MEREICYFARLESVFALVAEACSSWLLMEEV
jgi:hypothetical protein